MFWGYQPLSVNGALAAIRPKEEAPGCVKYTGPPCLTLPLRVPALQPCTADTYRWNQWALAPQHHSSVDG